MIKQLMALDGVMVVCNFRDDGLLVEGYGAYNTEQLTGLAKLAHSYKRMVQGNADQLAIFTQINGWTPPGGWIARGPEMTVCSMRNTVCVVKNSEGALNEVMQGLSEASRW